MNRVVRLAALLPLVALLAGCRPVGAVVTVDSASPLSGIADLRVWVANAGQTSTPIVITPAKAPFSIPPVRRFELTFPAGRSGTASLTVQAEDKVGQVIAESLHPFVLPGDSTLEIAIHLTPEGSDLGSGPCSDGSRDGDESDVDCGGSCPPCAVDRACSGDGDCATRVCDGSHLCALASGPPGWLPVAPMPTPRSNLAAVTLTDGRIVALGGFLGAQTFPPRATVEALDAFAGSWATLAPMGAARSGLAAAALSDGRIAVAGGIAQTTLPLASSEYYDPKSNSWTSGSNLTSARSAGAMVFSQDKLLFLGGATAGNLVTSAIDVSSPLGAAGGGSFSAFSPALPTALELEAAVTDPSGRVLVVGGSQSTSQPYQAALLALSTGAQPTWSSTLAPLPSPRNSLAAVIASDGRLYAIGGVISSGAISGVVEAYAPAADRWSTLPPLAQARNRLAAALGADGRIYAIGGFDGSHELASVEAYGPLLTLDAASAQPGAIVHATGSNFAANATVRFSLVQGASMTALAAGTTNAAGQLTGPVALTVPSGVKAGSYLVRAVDDRSLYPVVRPLAVP